jgi:peptidyl-prolyl cis-trans isomerase SurA
MRAPFGIALFTSLLLPLGLAGQDLPGQEMPAPMEFMGEEVDRVAAVVGDSVVLYSQVLDLLQQERSVLQQQGRDLPSDPDELRAVEREILESLVDQQLLLQAALSDTTVILAEDQVDRRFQQRWQSLVAQFQGEDNLRAAIEERGESYSGFRANERDRIRQATLIEQFIEARRREAGQMAVDESEVEAFWDEERTMLQQRPASISFRHAIVQPRPSESSMEEAIAEIERIRGMLEEGESFAELARRFSEDPGSREQGGELGWFRQGSDLDQDFEDAAFSIREGQIIGPVESSFGAHLIRVDRVRGPERLIRHILIGAELDVDGARQRAAEIRDAVEAGTSMREFSREHSIDRFPDSLDVPVDQLDDLPPQYANTLRDAQPGTVAGPIELPLDEAGVRVMIAVIEVVAIREAGEFVLDDLRDQIREHLRGVKFQERLMNRLRARTYVDIRI